MKKVLCLLLAVIMVTGMCACGGNKQPQGVVGSGEAGTVNPSTGEVFIEQTDPNYPVTMGLFYRNTVGTDIVSDDPTVKEVDEKADALLKSIEEAPDTLTANGGKTYYISADGSDTNDGLTPETAKKDYMVLKTFLQEGDLVLFRRGDIFRGQVKMVSGVSYGAYGDGVKPRFYGSTDASKNGDGKWLETETEGVYKYSQTIGNYSNIVFNNGEAVGRPVQKMSDITKRELNVVFEGKLYLYCPEGNPADVFDSIEIVDGYTLFTSGGSDVFQNSTIQNLCLMYSGIHGIGPGNSNNVTVEGCIIGFMGGKGLYTGDKSLGNAIEFFGGSTNITVRNNYLFQCYDTGVTHQGPSDNSESANFDNITYDSNLIEYCVWAIEAWIHGNGDPTAEDIATGNTWEYGTVNVTNNICRYTGWGWGTLDRMDKNCYSDFTYSNKAHTKMLTVSNNIFDRSRRDVFTLNGEADKNLLTITDNLIIAASYTKLARFSKTGDIFTDITTFENDIKKYSAFVSNNTVVSFK